MTIGMDESGRGFATVAVLAVIIQQGAFGLKRERMRRRMVSRGEAFVENGDADVASGGIRRPSGVFLDGHPPLVYRRPSGSAGRATEPVTA
jgi:hypothetical protein